LQFKAGAPPAAHLSEARVHGWRGRKRPQQRKWLQERKRLQERPSEREPGAARGADQAAGPRPREAGTAKTIGRKMTRKWLQSRPESGRDCLISGLVSHAKVLKTFELFLFRSEAAV